MPASRRRSAHLLLSTGLLTAACANAPNAPDGMDIGTLSQALDDAHTETTLTGVGSFDNPGDCTGSLVDPYWVLTAGHCDKDDNPLQYFLIGVGPNRSEMEAYPLDGVQYSQRSSFGEEVTLHRLKTPVRNVPLVPLYHGASELPWMNRVPIGETCTAVGYGLYKDDHGDIANGARRSRETVIQTIDPENPKAFLAGPEINPGDSGVHCCAGPKRRSSASQ